MNYCTNCGAPLQEGTRFCTGCGQPVAQPSQPHQQQNPNAQGTYNPNMNRPNTGYQAGTVPPKKNKSLGKTLLIVVLAIVVIVGAWSYIEYRIEQKRFNEEMRGKIASTPVQTSTPAQPQQSEESTETFDNDFNEEDVFNWLHPVDTRNLSTEVPVPDERWGNSEPLDYSPLEGFHITAERDAFKENTIVEITPLTTLTETALNAMDNIESEGFYVIDGYEVNAGLEDDEIMPGEYIVTMDLSVLDISPELYPYLTVFRVADDGSYYEYTTQIKDGKLVYRSDQNSLMVTCLVGALALKIGQEVEYYSSLTYYFDIYKLNYSAKRNWKGDVTYQLYWHMLDLPILTWDLNQRLKEIAQGYEDMKDKLYEKYLKESGYDRANPVHRFLCAKTVAQVVKEATERDEEYKQIKKELKIPEIVEYAIQCIDESFTYLKEEESLKMPTGVVQIISKDKTEDGALANATSRKANEGYVEIALGSVMNGSKQVRNDFLMTMTHELLHVCQQHYRQPFADNIRYDEMAAVYMEFRANDYYLKKGRITADALPQSADAQAKNWSVLKLPIDKYYGEDEGTTMKKEGYNLGLFVKYLAEKTGKPIKVGELMSHRSWWRVGGVSKPLMSAFDIYEGFFDIYYREFLFDNKNEIDIHYQYLSSGCNYNRNDEKEITKGDSVRVNMKTEGSYSCEIRGIQQNKNEPMNLVVALDEGFRDDHPECSLIPVGKFDLIPKGFYMPAVRSKKDKPYRDILEIHGRIPSYATNHGTGYSVYAWDKTKKPQAKEDKEHLIVRMPENSLMAKDGIVDGYELTIEAENGKELLKVVMPPYFEKEVKIDKSEIFGNTKNKKEMKVKITLCEFIRKEDKSRLRGEKSDVVEFTLSGYGRAENTNYDNPDDSDDKDNANAKYCWKLVDTQVNSSPNQSSEIGASCSYSATAGSHQKKGVHIGNEYKAHRYGFSATIQAPPKKLEAGDSLILHVTLNNTEGTEGYIFEEASLSFEDESIPMGFMSGGAVRGAVANLKGSTKVIIGGPSSGSWNYKMRIPGGTKEGQLKALNFFSCGSRTHWVYKWSKITEEDE